MLTVVKFIWENDLTDGLHILQSSNNLEYCIISGYAIYKGVGIWKELEDMLDKADFRYDESEFRRVFEYCVEEGYGDWWTSDSNRSEYVTTLKE